MCHRWIQRSGHRYRALYTCTSVCIPAKATIVEDASVRAARPTVDNLVIGGGLAGSMVAIRLVATGRQVTLLEKESAAHHRVCGEFLSPEAVEYLNQVGINPLDLGAATIRFVQIGRAHV